MSTVGVFCTVGYSNNKRFPPTVMNTLHGTQDNPHGTEHPHGTAHTLYRVVIKSVSAPCAQDQQQH